LEGLEGLDTGNKHHEIMRKRAQKVLETVILTGKVVAMSVMELEMLLGYRVLPEKECATTKRHMKELWYPKLASERTHYFEGYERRKGIDSL
jgi:hypothetical protein